MKLRVLAMRILAPACEAQRRIFRMEAQRTQAHAEDIQRELQKLDIQEARDRTRALLEKIGNPELA